MKTKKVKIRVTGKKKFIKEVIRAIRDCVNETDFDHAKPNNKIEFSSSIDLFLEE